ncbi:carboxypeptidase-like regulatory domain-containing protein [Zobellia nedashkovskayae]
MNRLPSGFEKGIHKNLRPPLISENNYLPPDQAKKKYTISGYITESGSGENLLGVSVYVPELKLGTTTNDYGFFSLTLPQGNHEVVISYIGYGNEKRQLNLLEDKILSIALKPSTQNLEEVVVTADERIKESKVTQMSKVQINPADIQDIPALLGEKDVMKTLQLMPVIQGGKEALHLNRRATYLNNYNDDNPFVEYSIAPNYIEGENGVGVFAGYQLTEKVFEYELK